ncbi:thiosulfate oxidation carrier complex protein SoxZ [Neorhizobium galegae]|uniref:thiosulfate oxidation carrier complex protein SoxZ n=1 Tax=Neorhizobium galegae TaxID=399 RepID=UPI002100B96C|nr:thiosulfate oxidation carrier complex protein SoxZ [Neorhizobium galegae]MCQ1570046.1 thiosulfate oxidation carrier complex protein SoxZ [Neorhizobium galegae]
MARVLINLPKAKRGEIVEIRTLIQHPMETGYRPKGDGTSVPRDIIRDFVCKLNDIEIFRADLFPAIAANPFLAFTIKAEEGGTMTFSWIDDRGTSQTEIADFIVE